MRYFPNRNIYSGKTIIDKEIRTNPTLIDQNEDLLYAYDNSSSTLKILDKKTGLVSKLGDAINFEGKESPSSINIRGNGILISSSQNLALVDYSGKTSFQTYLEAPREPGIIRALRYAQAIRAAYIGAVSYAGAGAYQRAANYINKENKVAGAMVSDIGMVYQDLGNQATDFAKKSWQMANARLKATKEADDYIGANSGYNELTAFAAFEVDSVSAALFSSSQVLNDGSTVMWDTYRFTFSALDAGDTAFDWGTGGSYDLDGDTTIDLTIAGFTDPTDGTTALTNDGEQIGVVFEDTTTDYTREGTFQDSFDSTLYL